MSFHHDICCSYQSLGMAHLYNHLTQVVNVEKQFPHPMSVMLAIAIGITRVRFCSL